MSNDYAKGFKDGFAAGLEEGKKLIEEQWRLDKIAELEKTLPKTVTRLDDYVFGSTGYCSVCGKYFGNNAWGYVCNHTNCPTRAVAHSTGATGAIGSTYKPEYPMGAVGPAGSFSTMNDQY